MQVYIVIEHIAFGRERIVDVFAEEAAAREEIARLREGNTNNLNTYYAAPYTVKETEHATA